MSKGTINFGHGKKSDGTFDPGSIGQTGLKESDVVKAIGLIVVSELQRLGHNINSIQSGDLWAVTDSSDNFNSEWFISIHNNSFSDKTANGIETHVVALGSNAEKLAKAIQTNLISSTGLRDRGIKVTNLYVNKYVDCPSCLVELPFISNPTEEKLLASPEFQRKCAISIVKGIQQYLGLRYVESQISSPTPTPSVSIMYRIILDNKQISAISNKDLAIAKVKELIDGGKATKGVVQRNTDNINIFEYPNTTPSPTSTQPTTLNFTYPNNAKIINDDLYIRDANGNVLAGRYVSKGDDVTILDISYSKQLIYLEYPTSLGVKNGYVSNSTNCIQYYYLNQWKNGLTSEKAYDKNGNVLGSLDSRESATPLYRKNGKLHVVYSTGKGVNSKSGFVSWNGGFNKF